MQYNAATGQTSAFPNVDWNTPKADNENFLSTVLGIRSDHKGVVWMLDMGFRNNITPKFVGWNTISNTLEKIVKIPAPASLPSSQLNDFTILNDGKTFIIADEDIGPNGNGSKAALIIVDITTGKSRRILQSHYSTMPEKNKPIVVDGRQLNIPGTNTPILVGADCITTDKNNEWLYYAPLNGSKLYRVRIQDVLNESLPSSVLESKVETYSSKENNGGASIDEAGNIYLTYLETKSIEVIPSGTRKPYRYASHPDLIWPDGASCNKDGYMYVPATQLPLGGAFNNGQDKTVPPYRIFRFKPAAKGIFGK
ncbi:major royal jelly family protein [Chryseobacterium sp. CH21]|uniref:major royal jelly family protein n=1 Tax=Chryseobacterium sp. CH21 TaxID=713556 RepID=UPI001E56CF01|nr:major royal jelly family protein [Chryseobacterium sp. CH21]